MNSKIDMLLTQIENTPNSVLGQDLTDEDLNRLADVAIKLLDTSRLRRGDAVRAHDYDRRWRLMIHASHRPDMLLWIEPVEGGLQAVEVDSGTTGPVRETHRQAMEDYWGGLITKQLNPDGTPVEWD